MHHWGDSGGRFFFRQLAFQQYCQGRAVHVIVLFSPTFLPAVSNVASGLPDSLASVILGNSLSRSKIEPLNGWLSGKTSALPTRSSTFVETSDRQVRRSPDAQAPGQMLAALGFLKMVE